MFRSVRSCIVDTGLGSEPATSWRKPNIDCRKAGFVREGWSRYGGIVMLRMNELMGRAEERTSPTRLR